MIHSWIPILKQDGQVNFHVHRMHVHRTHVRCTHRHYLLHSKVPLLKKSYIVFRYLSTDIQIFIVQWLSEQPLIQKVMNSNPAEKFWNEALCNLKSNSILLFKNNLKSSYIQKKNRAICYIQLKMLGLHLTV
jgi:hypothetical protein